jgi:receptor protein-tyrosine kinase
MDLNELLRVLWQRKLVAAATLLLVVGLGLVSLVLQTPVYQATSTVAVLPSGTGPDAADPIFVISQIDVITPLYAEAAKTTDTMTLARSLQGNRPIGDLKIRTFRGAPIIKIDVQSTDPAAARQSAQAVTDALLTRAANGEVGLTTTLSLSQIDKPQTPIDPVKPQPKLTILVSLILGIGFGVAAAVLWDRLLRKVESAEDFASATGLPVFGEVPSDRSVAQLVSAQDLVQEQRYRVVAEALRDIRTNLQFTNAEFRSVLVTSPEGRHGKTFLSFGLAATLARSGARTLLVDGDLRRGRVAEMLDVPREPGLMEVLDGLPLGEAVQATDLPGFDVLTGGYLVDDPGELLEGAFFPLLYDLEAAYDVVVIDGTPLVPVNDARLMARYVSSILLVVSAGTVTRRQVRTAVERLSIIGVDITAVVVNNSKVRRRASYYRYLRPQAKA